MSIQRRLHGLIFLFLIEAFSFQCQRSESILQKLIVHTILSEKNSFFYLDVQNYPQKERKLPIGIFDSGTGGLTVLDAIVRYDRHDNDDHSFREKGDGIRDFEKEFFIYLGDQANMPYGNYPREGKTDLLREHIIKDVQFLLGNKYYRSRTDSICETDKEPVKAIVIACNTATAFGKKDIEEFMDKAGLKLKVIGVIDAGVRAALSLFGKNEDGSIGIMATAGTVTSGGYVRTFNKLKREMGYTGDISVFQQAGVGLAGAIDGSTEYIDYDAGSPREDYRGPSETHPDVRIDISILKRYGFVGWGKNEMLFEGDSLHPKNLQINSIRNYISYHLVSLMEKIRKKADVRRPLKAIILGCTHYPFYSDFFRQKLEELYNYQEEGRFIYRPFMSRHVSLVNPALNIATELYEYLAKMNLFNNEQLTQSEFYVSVPNVLNRSVQLDSLGNFTYEYKYGRKAGFVQEYVKRVPFSRKSLSPAVVRRLSERVPVIFELIRNFNRSNQKTAFLGREERL